MNRVFLVGLVGCRSVRLRPSGELAFLVLTPRDLGGERVDRHRVLLSPHQLAGLAELVPGATVYVEGHLARHGGRGRACVMAERAWTVSPPPPPPRQAAPAGSHTPPREHLRAGHARRIAVGTPAERVVWVRPTLVRPQALHPQRPPTAPRRRTCTCPGPPDGFP